MAMIVLSLWESRSRSNRVLVDGYAMDLFSETRCLLAIGGILCGDDDGEQMPGSPSYAQ